MERLRGAPLTDLDAIRAATRKDPEAVLIAALNTWRAARRRASCRSALSPPPRAFRSLAVAASEPRTSLKVSL
jgi:hypothetical protein